MTSRGIVFQVATLLICVALTTGMDRCPDVPRTISDMSCAPRDKCKNTTAILRVGTPSLLRFQEANCFCDRFCDFFNDCCDNTRRHHMARAIPGGLRSDVFECRRLPKVNTAGIPINVVTRCPDEWQDDVIREGCAAAANDTADVFLRWPVWDNRQVVYSNVYCALCHGVTQHAFWRSQVSCVSTNNSWTNTGRGGNMSSSKDGCDVQFVPPGSQRLARVLRFCKKNEDKCPATWHDPCVKELCEGPASVTSYVYSILRKKIYRNKYCALCHDDLDVICEDLLSFSMSVGVQHTGVFYPLNILLDINPGSGSKAQYKVGMKGGGVVNETVTAFRSCSAGQVYDPFSGRCRWVTCPAGLSYQQHGCQILADTVDTEPDDCTLITLNTTEFAIVDNGSIFINITGRLHPRESYDLDPDGRAIVCTNFSQNYSEPVVRQSKQTALKFSEAQTVLSMVGQVISIVCLVLHLLVYLSLPSLRNLAGQNLMSLASALLVAQVLFLSGIGQTDIYGVCVTVAVLIHYSFLATFLWMSVMAFDIWKTFSQSVQASSSGGKWRRFCRYSAFAWGSPIALVSVALMANYTLPPDSLFRTGYGEGVCWISQRPALFLFFAFPVGMVLVANTVFFSLTSVAIWKVRETAKLVNHAKCDKYRFMLYIKLAAIMGLAWVFGFVAAATDSEVLWYMFIVFNTLQGAFLFLAFSFTRKVLYLLRDKFRGVGRLVCHRQKGDSTTGQTNSTGLSGGGRTMSASSATFVPSSHRVQL